MHLTHIKLMEKLQIGNMSSNTCIDFIQLQELIQKYNPTNKYSLIHVKKDKKDVCIVDIVIS